MNSQLARVRSSVSFGMVLFVLTIVPVVDAGELAVDSALTFRISDVVLQSDGVNPTGGTVHALLDLSGDYITSPPSISSLNVAFELTGQPASIAFGTPLDPVANKLIPSGVPFAGATVLPHTVRFAKDAGAAVPATDGGLMVSVPFTVAAGIAAGTYPIHFITGNELGSGNATALPIALVDGSITVLPPGPPIVGDYNRNGVVDAADYTLWRKTLGQTGAALAADGNGNNVIDAGDYNVWRANFGASGAGAAAITGIPEPSTVLMIAVALAAISVCTPLCRR